MDRRRFLATATTLPVVVPSLRLEKRKADRETMGAADRLGPWLEIQRSHLSWNVQQVARRVEGRPILAVLKANAYGHGLAQTARHLETLREIHGLAVFNAEEALELRGAGIRKPILVLGPTSETELDLLVRSDIMPSVYEDRGALLSRLAARYQKPVKVHLYLDTGLGRMGIPYYRVLPLIESLAAREAIRFDGILTPLTEEDDFDRVQLRRLQDVYDQARARGIDLGLRHAASSAAVFHLPEAFLDMVRPGICLYGCYPDERSEQTRALQLRPAMSLKARVMYVKQLRAGDSLQYHRAYVARKPVWVATLPVGYSDGWLRQAAGTCSVLIKRRRYPVIASVTSNHTLVEVGEEPRVQAGDEALLFGQSGTDAIDAHEVANLTNTSIYTLLIQMNPLLPRSYS